MIKKTEKKQIIYTSADVKPLTHCYVIDTNVLIYDPEALFAFNDSSIVIPVVVLEELDSFKGETSSRGRNAREIIRHLDEVRQQGPLAEGVVLKNGCTLRIIFRPTDVELPVVLPMTSQDNEILLTALALKQRGCQVVFVSKDINARVKADVLGIEAQDYMHDAVTRDHFYQGWVTLPVPAVQLKSDSPKELQALLEEYELMPNEFVVLESQHNKENYRIFRYMGGNTFKPVREPSFKWNLHSRNAQQLMALDLLLDDDVKLITLFGPAGTGKTFLALLAGLHKTLMEHEYHKILISRPVVPLGKDIGYLPGTVEEKLHSWMMPIFDNMEFIMHATMMGQHTHHHQQMLQEEEHGMRSNRELSKKHKKKEINPHGLRPLDQLVHDGKISLEAITYMRGRSIPFQYILIDEVQNLNPHEVKTLISRVGTGSKIILTGDPYQIDSPYLDFSSNGLVIVSERFKGQKVFGSVYLPTSERSELSQLVSELMQ